MAKRARQIEVPGTERKVNKEVSEAAETYVEERDKRIALSVKEKAAKTALIEVMKKNNVNVYRDDEADPPFVVTISTTDNVKVTEVQGAVEDDGEVGADA